MLPLNFFSHLIPACSYAILLSSIHLILHPFSFIFIFPGSPVLSFHFQMNYRKWGVLELRESLANIIVPYYHVTSKMWKHHWRTLKSTLKKICYKSIAAAIWSKSNACHELTYLKLWKVFKLNEYASVREIGRLLCNGMQHGNYRQLKL